MEKLFYLLNKDISLDIYEITEMLNRCQKHSYGGNHISISILSKKQKRVTLKPVFHWKLGLRWLIFALPMRKKVHKLHLHGQRRALALGTQNHLYSMKNNESNRV